MFAVLEERTRDEYRSFELHVRPFGVARQRLRDVTSFDVSDWFTELEQEGVKSPSIRKAKAALSAMLATAAQAGDIHGNPALGVRFVPSHAQLKRKRLTAASRPLRRRWPRPCASPSRP